MTTIHTAGRGRSRAGRGRLGALAAALVAAAGLAAGAHAAMGDDDFDRLIGMSQPVPTVFAVPATVTIAPTGIECYTLPCPYWKVEDATGSLLIGVERIVGSPEDTGVALENGLWAQLRDNGYAPLAVEGYVIDRPRAQGQPQTQRVFVVTIGPMP